MDDLRNEIGLVALPYERTTSFKKGTLDAPAAIICEIEAIDTFDFTLGFDPFKRVTRTVLEPHGNTLKDPEVQQAYAQEAVAALIEMGVFPLSLGGEHTVSLGPIRAASENAALGVVQLDAHLDLRDTFEGNQYSHACVMRRVHELGCPVMNIGARTMSAEEKAFIDTNRIKIVDGRRAALTMDWYQRLQALPKRVYLTIDMDVFDPSEVPAVGTPEPGGPGYDAVCAFLFYLFRTKEVVAADIVELKPSPNDAASWRLAARLAGLITGLWAQGRPD
jgi:agmatinase